MENLENKTTHELTSYLLQLKQEHEKVKRDMILSYDIMEKIEKDFLLVSSIISKRMHNE
jgi:hypothetical protein